MAEQVLAERLESLFHLAFPTRKGSDKVIDTVLAHVNAELERREERTISKTYLYALRNGSKSEPRLALLKALAHAFSTILDRPVTIDYLVNRHATLPTTDASTQESWQRIAGIIDKAQLSGISADIFDPDHPGTTPDRLHAIADLFEQKFLPENASPQVDDSP